jgi:hypothetical protein
MLAGGTIQDGEYVLSSVVLYDPNAVPGCDNSVGESLQASYTFVGGLLRIDFEPPGACIASLPYSVSGSDLVVDTSGTNLGYKTMSAPYATSADGLTFQVEDMLPFGGCTTSGGLTAHAIATYTRE